MPRPLPKSRDARKRLILKNSLGYVRRMGESEVDCLLKALAKTDGLSREDVIELQNSFFHVDWEYVPKRLRE